MERLRSGSGALLNLMEPYESLLESGIHELFNAQEGTAATPCHALVLEHLPDTDAPDSETCSICTETTEEPWTTLEPCGHKFHRSCCTTWLRQRRTCPLCRQIVRLNVSHYALHELLGMRNRLGLPRAEGMVERADLERQLREHAS
jgi:hypothetical protein